MPKLPAEFTGRARALIRALDNADKKHKATLNTIEMPLWTRFKAGRTIPRDMLTRTAYRWKTETPTFGRLDELHANKSFSRLALAEARAGVTGFRFPYRWPDAHEERGVVLGIISLLVSAREYDFKYDPRVLLSHHALARRCQRGFETGDDAVLADMGAMLAATTTLKHKTFSLQPPSGGCWVGEATITHDGDEFKRMLAVRSFVHRAPVLTAA